MNSLEKKIMARVPEQLKLKHQKVVQTPFGKMENHSYVPEEKEESETFEQAQERRAKEFQKEMYVQGVFLGFIIGALYVAIFSSILEKL
jgi:hypothetical protein